MVARITGSSHTGKTLLAQRLLERLHWPYLSIDHLKMGLIRSGLCTLTPESPDFDLTSFLWPVVREMVKTAIENQQNLIVEGCYIPFDCLEQFAPSYRAQIRFLCLIFSRRYLENHFDLVIHHANVIEKRLVGNICDCETLLKENVFNLAQCQALGLPYHLIDQVYDVEFLDLGFETLHQA